MDTTTCKCGAKVIEAQERGSDKKIVLDAEPSAKSGTWRPEGCSTHDDGTPLMFFEVPEEQRASYAALWKRHRHRS